MKNDTHYMVIHLTSDKCEGRAKHLQAAGQRVSCDMLWLQFPVLQIFISQVCYCGHAS